MAKRYGVLPSEVVKTGIEDFQFNLLTICTGISAENKANEKAK